jgi:hypothetical protein
MVYTDLANDFRFCREVTRKSASSFYYALRFLPAARRKALYAVYAFCRAVDDAVDETTGADAAGPVRGQHGQPITRPSFADPSRDTVFPRRLGVWGHTQGGSQPHPWARAPWP